jgi:hypothetical protein
LAQKSRLIIAQNASGKLQCGYVGAELKSYVCWTKSHQLIRDDRACFLNGTTNSFDWPFNQSRPELHVVGWRMVW